MYNTNIDYGAWVVPQAKDCHEFNIITSTETSSRVASAGADMAVMEQDEDETAERSTIKT